MALLFSANVYADNFGEGLKAFEQQDYQKARKFYEKACNGGDASGCFNLGELYRTGEGVPQDFSKAKELYKKACDEGLEVGCEKYHSLKQKIGK